MIPPFEVGHTDVELYELSRLLRKLDGDTRVVMEATENHHILMASFHYVYISVVNAMLVHDYGNNSLWRAKTDKKAAIKLANYCLDHWLALPRYILEDEVRLMLKPTYRQCQQCAKVQTMRKNNLISLLDTAFPDVNRLFTIPIRADGNEKWVDFVAAFWHYECVCGLTEKGLHPSIRSGARNTAITSARTRRWTSMPPPVGISASCPRPTPPSSWWIRRCPSSGPLLLPWPHSGMKCSPWRHPCPEYPVVMKMFGVGPALAPQLMAEIGNVRRFHSQKALMAFAGINASSYQSGQMEVHSRSISKRVSSALRRTLFLVMSAILRRSPADEPVYRFIDKKRAEGEPYRVYMMASANKVLRIYYATVKQYLENLEA